MDFVSNLKNKFTATPDNHFLALELGTRAAKALIVKSDGQKGYVLGAGHQDFLLDQIESGQIRHISSVAQSVDIAIEKAIDLAGVKPKYTVVNAVSPQQINQIQRVVFNRQQPKTKISRSELTDIFSVINQRLTTQFRRHYDGYELASSIILDCQVDQTTVKNPLDFTGRDLNFLIYQSYLPLIQVGAFQSVLDELKLTTAGFVSQPYAIFKAFDATLHQYKNSLFIDIGGALTEIIICSEGQLQNIDNINLGGDFFTSQLAEAIDEPFDKAEQYKKDYAAGLLAKETETQLQQLFMESVQHWLKHLEAKIDQITTSQLPPKIYLSGGGILLPEVEAALEKSPKFAGHKISRIHTIDIESIVDKTGQVNYPYYISSLALARTGLSFQNQSHPTAQLYQKFIQTLRT